MSDWSAGYVADIGYTYGYYGELNPLRIKLAFLNAGLNFPEVGTACELGFGQGLSTNIHAAASTVQWYGTDFNPAQAGFAQEMASASGVNAHLYDQAFAEFCSRPDLPDFDSIGLHGIWSWISNENRTILVDFIRRKLKVGGVLYVSYNTQPGHAHMVPMRDLMTRYSEIMCAPGKGIVSRIDETLEFVDRLVETNPNFTKANPALVERLKQMKGHNRNYLAHEYFNRDWLPMSFAEMADWLEPAKLNYACSAHYIDHVEVVNFSAEQRAFLAQIPDRMFREQVKDFMMNQQFRRDYWVRGARQMSAVQQVAKLREQRLMLILPKEEVPLKVRGAQGEAALQESIYGPVLTYLADHKTKTIAQIEKALVGEELSLTQLMQAIMVLTGMNVLQAVQDDAVITRARKQTDKLNLHICALARGSTDVAYLASPVTGGAVGANRIAQLFMLARGIGHKQPADWAAYVADIFIQQGQRVAKAGVALESTEEQLLELTEQANVFAQRTLPLFKALGIVS